MALDTRYFVMFVTRKESSAVCNGAGLLKILHGFDSFRSFGHAGTQKYFALHQWKAKVRNSGIFGIVYKCISQQVQNEGSTTRLPVY